MDGVVDLGSERRNFGPKIAGVSAFGAVKLPTDVVKLFLSNE